MKIASKARFSLRRVYFILALGLAFPWVQWARAQTHDQMVEAAKKEGEFNYYASMDLQEANLLVGKFKEKYPFLDVKLNRADSERLLTRVLAEAKAKKLGADAIQTVEFSMYTMKKQGILGRYMPSDNRFYPAEFKDDGFWTTVYYNPYVIGYNTKLMSKENLPKTYDDLLSPKWRGRMAMSGSVSTAANFVAALVLTKGEDFVRKLAEQNIRIYPITARALANLVISGEVAISPTIYNSHVEASAATGAPLAWIAPGPVPVTDTAVALARGAPSPHAAMLLIDYLLSREGQRIYGSLGYGSARKDSARQAASNPAKKLYLANRPDYLREFAGWSKLYQAAFLRR